MLRRMMGTYEIAELRILADAVEPTKDYTRTEVWPEPPTLPSPLNRLADAARPESTVARHFRYLVDGYVTNAYGNRSGEAEIRAWLLKWQGNHERLRPLLEQSSLLAEDQPLSEDLAALATAGLQSLDAISKGQTLPASWRSQQTAIVERSLKPRANLLIMVAPAIQRLIDKASPATPGQP